MAWTAQGYLDSDENHPALFGDCILLRDDDGMGFALNLQALIGKHVRITIEETPSHDLRIWPTAEELKRGEQSPFHKQHVCSFDSVRRECRGCGAEQPKP